MAKSDEPFNRPFSSLKGMKIRKKGEEEKKPSGKAPQPKEHSDDGSALFAHAMDGVKPIESDQITHDPVEVDTVIQSIHESIRRQDTEVLNTLNALTSGKARFDVTCTGEYLEGNAIPLDPTTLKKLKAGEFTTQAYLDLHGYTKDQARSALNAFLTNAHAMGNRALLVIHGRGLKSSEGPVLKEHVVKWLTTGGLSHLVLAFCSARPCDGGTGALYVLLRRRPRKSKWRRPL